MSIGAIVVPGDTVVMQSEGRVPVNQMLAGPKVLSEAKWIPANRPLDLGAGGRLRYGRNGAPKFYAPGSISLLGMFRGTPVFVDRKSLKIRPQLEALSARGVDLEKALRQQSNLRREVERITELYIPTALAGCQFQPFRKVPPPRRR